MSPGPRATKPSPRRPTRMSGAGSGRAASSWRSSPWVPRASEPRSPARGCWRRGSARARSCGRTRSRRCWWRCRSATRSAGRLADRNPRCRGSGRDRLPAAALLAAVPFVERPFLPLSVRAFDELVVAALFIGSLLGRRSADRRCPCCCSDGLAVRRAAEGRAGRGRRTGGRPALRASARSARSTGTFLAALLLIPVVGTHRTFLALRAGPGPGRPPGARPARGCSAAVVAAVIAGALRVPVGTTKSATSDGKVIWERETEYQYARVIEDPDGDRR